MVRFPEPRCERCDLPRSGRPPGSDRCEPCRDLSPDSSALDGLRVVGPHAGLLREAIHTLKYVRHQGVAAPLSTLLVERWRTASIPVDGVIPVPLHPTRLRERGYNQSHLLAEPFARLSNLPLQAALLQRLRPTPPQVGLDRATRHDNVAGAFAASGGVSGGAWLLIDDVCTTGATLEACAATLRAGGARAVWALTLTRPYDKPIQPEMLFQHCQVDDPRIAC